MGYSNKKLCQEALLGILGGAEYAKIKGRGLAVISLDIKKAFDSVSHSFLEETLKFFNLGPVFIKWIKLLCMNREACIILDVNKTGKSFKLERGKAQGDTISPFLFNICYQILLLKLENSLQIQSVFSNSLPGEEPIGAGEPQPGPEELPVRLLPRKVFAFADDCNILTIQDQGCITEIKNILNNFQTLSGLECNLSKTNILHIHPEGIKMNDTGFHDCD
jgi:retron-type reverse transcriptase